MFGDFSGTGTKAIVTSGTGSNCGTGSALTVLLPSVNRAAEPVSHTWCRPLAGWLIVTAEAQEEFTAGSYCGQLCSSQGH